MAQKPTKFLVETSVCMAALKGSTPKHMALFQSIVGGGRLFTSAYLRMEFIRRWVCGLIKMAMISNQSSSIAHAFHHLEQDFSGRTLKIGYSGFGEFWQNFRDATTPGELAEEFAHAAVNLLERFDAHLPSRINNASQCEIGAMELTVDFNNVLADLADFHATFTQVVTNCGVNGFLRLDKPQSGSNQILRDEDAGECTAAKNLKKLADKKTWITCKECVTISDVVIALEQPSSWHLIHGDKAFPHYCGVLKKPETYVTSVQALENSDPNAVWKL